LATILTEEWLSTPLNLAISKDCQGRQIFFQVKELPHSRHQRIEETNSLTSVMYPYQSSEICPCIKHQTSELKNIIHIRCSKKEEEGQLFDSLPSDNMEIRGWYMSSC